MSRHDDDSVTPERFALVRRTFEAALDYAPQDRRAFLEGICRGDRPLFDEVLGMLAHDEQACSRLDSPTAPAMPDRDGLESGSVIAQRYRVGSCLGRGGMGEVYLAQDLILNQPVALKFLASAHASDAALKRFRNEVRLARQVSHPNVCRVYDVGMVDGRHFLSMEYIDGEDLSSLLRRAGRLPDHYAIELTRRICAGLHAAHDRGVLHRDLKPANIMIDAGGQPHITDFGVASLAHDVSTSDVRSGTPAYMSPEQKVGIGVSVRSDLYALGVVLYEMFAGSAAQDVSSIQSGLRKVDPAVQRIILRCLEEDPRRRPRSALEVAMAMPGGDPIAAAMAAGETPSPETVAASDRIEPFSTRTAALCMAGIVVAAILSTMFSHNSRLLRIAPLEISAENLAFHAAEILRSLGYAGAPVATAYGFECCDVVALRDANRLDARERDRRLGHHQPPVATFWYRQHQDRLFEDPGRRHLGGVPYSVGVGYDQPANDAPGMIRLKLDAKGRLLNLEGRPVSGTPSTAPRSAESVWPALFNAAGLDIARFTRAPPRGVPSMAFDARAAWTGTYAAGRDEPVQVDAAAWEGRPVHFSVAAADGHTDDRVTRPPALVAFLLTLVVLTSVAAGVFAVRNVRAGRGDRSGAWTVAIVSAASMMGGWAFGTTHVAHSWELALIFAGIGRAAAIAGLLGTAYLAVEPYVRRYWPESLISWNRLRRGRLRDPLVASHVLAGISAWMVISAVAIPLWQIRPVWAPELLTPLDGSGQLAAFLAQVPAKTLTVTLSFLVIVVALRVLARRRMWVADVLACVVFAFTGPLDVTGPSAFVLSAAIVVPTIYVTIPWLIGRFGVVALMSAWAVRFLLVPVVPGSWYAGRGLFVALIPVAVGAWATWVIAASPPASRSQT